MSNPKHYIETKPFIDIIRTRADSTYNDPDTRGALNHAINNTLLPWCMSLQIESKRDTISPNSKRILEILQTLWWEDKKNIPFDTNGIA